VSDIATGSPSWIQPLGWALVQFLWQGTLIAVLFATVRVLAGRWLTAHGRYLLACAALAIMAAAPALTFAAGSRLGANGALTAWPLASAGDWRAVMPWLVSAWACGVLAFSVRLVGGWRAASRLQSIGVGLPPSEWQASLDRLAARLRVARPVQLLVSSVVEVPSVVGWLRPVVLMPVGALAGLPTDHVMALLAHELAHVRRHDYLVNVMQRCIETLLFYHPAVWWMSGQVRIEREMCCDDLAVAAHGDALIYARALTDLESARRGTAALAANGASLVERIRRLLGQGHSLSHMLPGPAVVAAMSALWAIGIAALAAQGSGAPGTPIQALRATQPIPQRAAPSPALLSTMLLGPIGPAPEAETQQPSTSKPTAPVSGAPGTTTDTRRDPSEIPQTGTGIIRGQIVRADGQPLRKVRIALRASGVRDLPIATTDDKGRYELKGLPPGRFTLTATKGGFVTLEYGQRRAGEPGRPIELAEGQLLERVDLMLPAGGVITGVVLDEAGEPLAGAPVQAQRRVFAGGMRQPAQTPSSLDVTDDLGQFRLFGLPPGSYYVSAEAGRSGFALQAITFNGIATYYPGTLLSSEATPVAVSAGEEVSGLSFGVRPVKTSTVTGVVRALEGRVPADATISLAQVTPGGGTNTRNGGPVRPDGSFMVRDLLPGAYTVSVRLPPPSDQIASEQVVLQGGDTATLALTLRKANVLRGRVTFESDAARSTIQPSSVRIRAEGVLATPGTSRLPAMAQPLSSVAFFGLTARDDWTFEGIGLIGRPRLRVTLPEGWAVKSIQLRGKDVTDSPLDFTDGDVEGVEVQLTQRITTLTGLVTDERGQVIADATVVVFADDPGRWGPGTRFVRTARPDQEGRFRIQGLPPSRYMAVALDFLESGEEAEPETLERLRKLGTSVALSEAETRTLDLRVRQTP
jgi:protocatechuate 3,4-dioxygenase beta subunit/Zn-dependent protease with chaperone function